MIILALNLLSLAAVLASIYEISRKGDYGDIVGDSIFDLVTFGLAFLSVYLAADITEQVSLLSPAFAGDFRTVMGVGLLTVLDEVRKTTMAMASVCFMGSAFWLNKVSKVFE